MEQYYKEPTPVTYSTAGIIRRHYFRYKSGVRLHWHDRMELIRLHAGQVQVGYGENTAILSPGEIYVVPPRTPHAVKLLSGTVEYDVLMFDVRWFYNEAEVTKDRLRSIYDGRAHFQMTTDDSNTVECFDRLCAVSEEATLETVGLVYMLLQQLLEHAVTELSRTPKGDPGILEILSYMEENFDRELSTELLAERSGYSAAHFCRKFKETTWLTPMNYLRIYRLEEAARRLRQGDGSVSDVALACGFPDPNYFTRCFKKHFGVPPTKYEKTEKRSST
ncbi:MAG: helix-turn-helix transcriptional regulator [Oscillospiraceae bacterium]|nr:helix-turn-helix transcriptional regulator [Oscillospiraceae bacterium]